MLHYTSSTIFAILAIFLTLHTAGAQVSQAGIELSYCALELTEEHVVYDPTYRSIDYPMGDVPSGTGVCTDVVIRAYRKMGVDLQQLVHQDMRAHFSVYPDRWGLKKPDTNIDHRRVPNLMTFFERHGDSIEISLYALDYLPGDIVCWDLGEGITHIGIVSDLYDHHSGNPLMIHNIGTGQVLADCLFSYQIIGHYRYVAQ